MIAAMPSSPSTESPLTLRIALADEDRATLRPLAGLLEGLGHEVTALAVTVDEASTRIAATDPQLAIVVLHQDDEHALDLIEELAEALDGPVIVLLEEPDAAFLAAAASRGIAAFASAATADEIQGAMEVAIRRHGETQALSAEVDTLRGALERLAVVERAKGILMERHGIDERAAFELLRGHARKQGRRVVDLAAAVADGHALLPAEPA